jgi:curved DNA-binding protein CbpA
MTYYELLELSPEASLEEIREAHRIAVQLFHPDQLRQKPPNVREAAEERLKKVNEAFRVLSDPIKRSKYDSDLKRRPQNPFSRRTSPQPVGEERAAGSLAESVANLSTQYIFLFSLLGLIIGISIQYYFSYSRCNPNAQQLVPLWYQLMQCDVDFITEPVKQSSTAGFNFSKLLFSVPSAGIRIIITFFLPVICGSLVAFLCKIDFQRLNFKSLASRGGRNFVLTLSYVITGGIFVVLFYPIYILIKGLIPIAFTDSGALENFQMISLIILYSLILFVNASVIIVSIND